MSTDTEKSQALTRPVFHILLALADGERHGYAIMQEVAHNTKGQMEMGPGTLYGNIKRLLAMDLIEESDERPDPEMDDERRRYYRLTSKGQKILVGEVSRMNALVKVARSKQLIKQFI